MIEIWAPVVRYEGYYEVSDLGNVYRLQAAGSRLPGPCKLHSDGGYGYLRASLCRDGKDVLRRVHKIVTEAFLGPCPKGMEVLHGPGGRHDNSLANLSYGTHARNCAETVRDGNSLRGTRHPSAVLTEEIVMKSRRRHLEGETIKLLADEYEISYFTMYAAVTGANWKHLPLAGVPA